MSGSIRGWESGPVTRRWTSPPRGGSFDLSGWEYVNVQLGVDFALSSAVKIGPWVSFSLTQYSNGGISSSGAGVTTDIANKTLHEWLMIGVRLVFLP